MLDYDTLGEVLSHIHDAESVKSIRLTSKSLKERMDHLQRDRCNALRMKIMDLHRRLVDQYGYGIVETDPWREDHRYAVDATRGYGNVDIRNIYLTVAELTCEITNPYQYWCELYDHFLDACSTYPQRTTEIKRDTGFVFLYPNGIYQRDMSIIERQSDYGYPQSQRYVECWITSNFCDNWSRHGYPIDEYLPVELFLGKKEGDSVRFMLHGREIKLFLRQQWFRYGGINFEDLLQRMLNRN